MDRTPPIVSIFPGYKGYRDKENRRDTDKQVRDLVAERLGQSAEQVERVAADLANRREIMAVGSVGAEAEAIRHLQNQIATATYGYGGLWGANPVDATALDQLVQFDTELLARVDALGEPVQNVESARDLSSREAALVTLRTVIDGLQRRFDERSHVIETGLASAPSTATAPLSGGPSESTKPLPPAAFGLGMGDQLLIRGQQVVVTATIDISGDQPFRLFRIGANPARWLLVNQRFAADTTASEIVPTQSGATANGEELTLRGSGTATATMTGLGTLPDQRSVNWQVFEGTSGNETIVLSMTWNSTGLSLVGRRVPPEDLDVPEQIL